ncbi:MAG: fumarylacetoacetate hydrolase family protein, partial [Bacillota bacterium]|nr:fumarylacetoacetate hydrolase family protein [Bacillota bacterium]
MLYIRAQKARKTFWAVLTDKDEVKVLKKAPYKDLVFSGETYRLSEVKLLAPCEPTKIVAVGKNYKDHALEMKSSVPDHPIIFIKPATSLNNPEDDIVYPEASKRVDYEGELAFVVKKKAHMIKKDNAFDYILGYTCLNDVTARDIQDLDGQWTRSKSFDGFAPVGPWVVDGIKPSG